MSAPLSDARRWRAVVRRDARYDDTFVYGVKTTNVFCKPSCGSRRPHRENVVFFSSVDAAAGRGYRECAKCRPASGLDAERIVRAAVNFLEGHLDERVTLTTLAQHVALSPFYLQRLFKRYVGVSPRMYVATRRAERLKIGLRRSESVAAASIHAGYADERAAYGDAMRALGMSPGAYRRRGAGKEIAYKVFRTRLGNALIAATAHGVAAIYLGEDRSQLEADLHAEYPSAKIARCSAGTGHAITAFLVRAEQTVHEQLAGHKINAMPLDVGGTRFQSEVWDAIAQIPTGETRTYQQIARAIGKPGGVRAVARACATNKVALVIPCHRVVRTDGALANYRWGVERKRALLATEKAG